MAAGTFIPKHLVLAIGMALLPCAVHAEYPSPYELSGLNSENGFRLEGENAGDWAGAAVASAGDFNSDGIADLIIGAPNADTGAQFAGAAYIVYGSDGGFSHPLDLSTIDASSGMLVIGVAQFDSVGTSVASAGDVNGDGFDDVVIGASTASPNGSFSGATYVIYGSNQALPGNLDLADIDGNNGVIIHGEAANHESGTSVDGAGDINGDGIDDLIIGAPQAGNGAAYVVFGDVEGLAHPVSLASLDGSNGFKINAAGDADSAGSSVSAAGDFNEDGIDDVAIGATLAGTVGDYAGAAYVVFGTDQGFISPVNLAALDGNNGITLNGVNHFDEAGYSLDAAGDVNGDGIDDLVIGAPRADPNGDESGAAYVVFGDQSPVHPVELTNLDGTDGLVMNGAVAGDRAGVSVGSAGNLDADNWDDLVVGANAANPHGDESGASYVVYGSNQAWSASLELSGLDGEGGFVLNGVAENDWTGIAVQACGDLNNDSYTDLVIGAPRADPGGDNSGAVYVVYGGSVGSNDIIFSDGFE